MEDLDLLLARLHSMVGARVSFRNSIYTVMEVIDDIPAIIILNDHPASTIQADVHGRARKHTKEVITISVLNSDRTALHHDFLCITLL